MKEYPQIPQSCPGSGLFACGKSLRDHPVVPGFEMLHRTCDGRLVKL